MTTRRFPRWLLLAACYLALAGCGPALYLGEISSAEDAVDRAREANASWHAPYEFHFALAHLEKAREEASHASYEDAIRYAETARDYGERARKLALRGGPAP